MCFILLKCRGSDERLQTLCSRENKIRSQYYILCDILDVGRFAAEPVDGAAAAVARTPDAVASSGRSCNWRCTPGWRAAYRRHWNSILAIITLWRLCACKVRASMHASRTTPLIRRVLSAQTSHIRILFAVFLIPVDVCVAYCNQSNASILCRGHRYCLPFIFVSNCCHSHWT